MIFQPFTIGYDWEVGILNPDLSNIAQNWGEAESKFTSIYLQMRSEQVFTRTGWDNTAGGLLEHRSGIMKSWDELWERSHSSDELARKICKEKNYVYWPVGSRPLQSAPIGCHMHVGSIYDASLAVKLHHAFLKYMPALIALSANSPFFGTRTAEYKSYRGQFGGWGSGGPMPFGDIEYFQPSRNDDFNVWTPFHPTVEARCFDSTSSTRFLCELMALWSCSVAAIGNQAKSGYSKKLESNYQQYLKNRLMATKYGLQATFDWNDGEIKAGELVKWLLEIADPKMKLLKTNASEMKLIDKMIQKRQTQADMALVYYRLNPDPHRFAQAYANILPDQNLFEKYLDMAPELPSLEKPPLEEIILAEISAETALWSIQKKLHLPFSTISKMSQKLEREGRIKAVRNPEKGMVYTKKCEGRRAKGEGRS